MKLLSALAVLVLIASLAFADESLKNNSELRLVHESAESTHKVAVMETERVINRAVLRVAISITEFKAPMSLEKGKPVMKLMKTALYDCANKDVIILSFYFLAADNEVLSANEVNQAHETLPGTQASKEFDYVCSRLLKPPQLDPSKMI